MKDYKRLYEEVISNAKKEEELGMRSKKSSNYYERHHILPKSLFPEHAKDKSNVVLLTAAEHFRCHMYLTHIYPSSQMSYALHAFISRPNSDYKITEAEYEEIRKDFSKRMREQRLGRPRSKDTIAKGLATKRKNGTLSTASRPEVRAKISNSLKGRPSPFKGMKKPGWSNSTTWVKGNTPWNKGKSCEVFAKKGKRNPMYGKHWYTDGKNNICDYTCPEGYHPGVTRNIDKEKEAVRRQKISKSSKGKHWFNNGVTNKLCDKCPEGYVAGFLTPRIYDKGVKCD